MGKKKIPLDGGEKLAQQPFAALGAKFGIAGKKTEPEPEVVQEAKTPQPMLLVRLEKRKKGKVVTAVYHLVAEHEAVLKRLKQKLATGGSRDGECLALQGDHRTQVSQLLKDWGFKVRQA